MGAAETYTDEMLKQFDFLATWPPSMHLTVGTIGTMSDRVFVPISHVSNFGIDVAILAEETTADAMTYTSKQVTSIDVATGVEVPALDGVLSKVGAKLDISFKRANATIFRASNLTGRRLADEPALARQLARLVETSEWDRRWQVVTHVIEAASLTVLISNSNNSKVELAVDASVTPGGVLDLLDADLAPRVARQSDMHTVLFSSGTVTPLFRSKRVRRTFFTQRPELRAGWAVDLDQVGSETAEHDLDLLESVTSYTPVTEDDPAR